MKIIKIRIDITSNKSISLVTENFDYAVISVVEDSFGKAIDEIILLITDELVLNSVEEDYDLEFVYRCKLRR